MNMRLDPQKGSGVVNAQLFITFLAILGFVLSFYLLVSDAINLESPIPNEKGDFNMGDNPTLTTWIFTISCEIAFTFAIAPLIGGKLNHLHKEYQIPNRVRTSYLILAMTLIGLPILIQVIMGGENNIAAVAEANGILFRHPFIVFRGSLLFFAFFVGLCLLGIFLLNFVLPKNSKEKVLSLQERELRLKKSLVLRKELIFFLSILGIYLILFIFILLINWLLLNKGLKGTGVFSQGFIYLLPALYSFFVAGICLPVYVNFKNKIKQLQEIPLESDNQADTSVREEDKYFTQEIIDQVKKLITEDKLEEAFNLALQKATNLTAKNTLTLLKQRWSNMKNKSSRGLVSDESVRVENTNIAKEMISVLDT